MLVHKLKQWRSRQTGALRALPSVDSSRVLGAHFQEARRTSHRCRFRLLAWSSHSKRCAFRLQTSPEDGGFRHSRVELSALRPTGQHGTRGRYGTPDVSGQGENAHQHPLPRLVEDCLSIQPQVRIHVSSAAKRGR